MSKRYDLLLLLTVIVFSIIVVEVALRFMGYKPGVFLTPNDIKNYDIDFSDPNSICNCPYFVSDSDGLFKLGSFKNSIDPTCKERYPNIQSVLKTCKTDQFGFRNSRFDIQDTLKERVMIIGDSYTFGFDAYPWDSSFCDMLPQLDTNLNVFNAGIPGADLATYENCVRIYTPIIRPKFIIVNLNKGDIVQYNKVLQANENNDIYITNKGILFKENYHFKSDSLIVYSDYKNAYSYLKQNYTHHRFPNSLIKFLFNNSALLTLSIIVMDSRLEFATSSDIHSKRYKKENCSTSYIQKIIEHGQENNATTIFSVIPGPPPFDKNTEISRVQLLAGNQKINYPDSLQETHYFKEKNKNHFNNLGHFIYAEHLLRLLRD